MARYRNSALLLHGLRRKDQQWLLQRLSRDQRTILEPLLLELHQLGIPRSGIDPALLAEKDPLDAGVLETAGLEMLDQAYAEQIESLLRDEAPQVVAALLSLHDWSWRQELLRRFSPQQRQTLERFIEQGRRKGLPLKLRQGLLAGLGNRLREAREVEMQTSLAGQEIAYRPGPGLLGQFWRSLWPA